MSSPCAHGSSTLKRPRTVEGSCWPCKQRRVKCDLQKPACQKCLAVNPNGCSYAKTFLRWKQRPCKRTPAVQSSFSDMIPLVASERRAIEYFKNRVWPLLSTVQRPCPPPIALALHSQPVLQALCVFAEEHRALQERKEANSESERRRLQCLTIIRGQLEQSPIEKRSLSALLVAVMLLYLLEGYINCTQHGASTQCHLAGALAIIDALGGFQAAWSSSDEMTRMLLSELASADLTDALLHNRKPSFPVAVWSHMGSGSVWWEILPSTKSLAVILGTMAEMSFFRHELLEGVEAKVEAIQAFEHALQPMYCVLKDQIQTDTEQDFSNPTVTASLFLNRAFQHAGLIYLYRAIHRIPTEHHLVQQHVHACLGSIQGMDATSRPYNCILFPLYVAGAHAITESSRRWVLEVLDVIHINLRFESVRSIRSSLQHIWQSSQNTTTWSGVFQDAVICTLVI